MIGEGQKLSAHLVPLTFHVVHSSFARQDDYLLHLIPGFDGVYHGHVVGSAEDRMHSIQMRLGRMTNEELTTPGISSSVSHGKRAGEMFVGIDLALNRVAWSSSPIPIGAACLNDEVGDDTMKGKSIIES